MTSLGGSEIGIRFRVCCSLQEIVKRVMQGIRVLFIIRFGLLSEGLMKTLEAGTAQSSGLDAFFEDYTDHLDTKDAEFLKHWNTLLNKEEKDLFRFRNELWTMVSSDREKVGRYFLAFCDIIDVKVLWKSNYRF
jgi:hypothetical protein